MDATNSPSATSVTSATQRPANPAGGALSFPGTSRLLRPTEFRRVYDNGMRIPGPLFTAFCLAQPVPEGSAVRQTGARLGLTVPKAVGPAVERNRIKRRLREAFRLHHAGIAPQWDIVLNPRRAVLHAGFPEIEQALRKVIDRCNSR